MQDPHQNVKRAAYIHYGKLLKKLKMKNDALFEQFQNMTSTKVQKISGGNEVKNDFNR